MCGEATSAIVELTKTPFSWFIPFGSDHLQEKESEREEGEKKEAGEGKGKGPGHILQSPWDLRLAFPVTD